MQLQNTHTNNERICCDGKWMSERIRVFFFFSKAPSTQLALISFEIEILAHSLIHTHTNSLAVCLSPTFVYACVPVCIGNVTMVDPFSQQDGKISTLLHWVCIAQHHNKYTPNKPVCVHFFPIRTTHYLSSTRERERTNERTSEKLHTPNVARSACCCISQ